MKSKGEPAGGVLLDTHIWYWYTQGLSKLAKEIQILIADMASRDALYLSAMTLWEISMLVGKGRISLSLPLLPWLENTLAGSRVTLLNVSPAIAAETAALPESFHGDPSDRLIAATARVHNLSLMTRDKSILRHGESGFLKCVAA
jgi:PIN domain nuclease of toxin-antitoxin system